jgi:uncharacterized protein with HEPN domain
MNNDKQYLSHLRDCVVRVEQYIVSGKKEFMTSTLRQDAVLRNLQLMAESTLRLSEELRFQHIEVPWREIANWREILGQNYLVINLDEVWRFIELRFPQLKQQVNKVLQQLPS